MGYKKIKPKFDSKDVAWENLQDIGSNFNSWSLMQEVMLSISIVDEYRKQQKDLLERYESTVSDILIKDIRSDINKKKVFLKRTLVPDGRGIKKMPLPTMFYKRTIPIQFKEYFTKAKKNSLYEITGAIHSKPYSRLLNRSMIDSIGIGGQQVFYEFDIDTNFQHLNPKIVEWGESYNLTLADRLTKSLTENIKFTILEGIQSFEGIPEIRERILDIFDSPIIVQVPAKVSPDGELIRRAYEKKLSPELWATMVARSEVIRWAANGKVMGYKQTGVVKGVIFTATGDHRTCEDCMILHGTEFRLEESIGIIPIHCQGRCTWIPVIIESANVNETAYNNIIELYDLEAA